jgi:uncharacterized protein (TIGR01777 family)
MRALVTGATGFVGQQLLKRLERPIVLSRSAERARKTLSEFLIEVHQWDAEHDTPPLDALRYADVIFHLAGDPVAEGRWTAEKRVHLRESRVSGTRHLVEAIAHLPPEERPRTLISASAVGYYGNRGDDVLEESASAGEGFLAEICVAWEQEAMKAAELGLRVAMPRIGIVLGPKGGALAKMLPPFKLWAGSPLGNGKQWMPWIHLDDLVSLLLFLAEQPALSGPFNATAPNPVTNREFTRVMAQSLGVPAILPGVPGFALHLMLGDFAEVLLASQRAVPSRAMEAGFAFEYPKLTDALRDIL